eukprot:1003182_1
MSLLINYNTHTYSLRSKSLAKTTIVKGQGLNHHHFNIKYNKHHTEQNLALLQTIVSFTCASIEHQSIRSTRRKRKNPNTANHIRPELKPQSVALKADSLSSYDWVVIIHTCDHSYASSSDAFYVRLHATYDTTEWFQLQNDAMASDSLGADDVYIYHIETDAYIGSEVSVIDFQAVDSDATCIDMVSVARASSPYYWKGSSELFWLDNPCVSGVVSHVMNCIHSHYIAMISDHLQLKIILIGLCCLW